ncbi:MAG: hypothetical protein K8R25_17820 [Methanosarcinales archaeon]|nr:hypothetical protein [Methanosarcinales archaeon]
MKNKGIKLGALLAAMLILSMTFVPAVSASKELNVTQKTSELEQGLIDVLNSKKEGSSTEDIITKYIKSNKQKIKSYNNVGTIENITAANNIVQTYNLNNGLQIEFTDGDFFYVTEIKKETNTMVPRENQKNGYTPAVGIQSMSYTPLIEYSWSAYSWAGIRCFTIHTKGYFGYDETKVEAHHVDSWYTKGFLSIWQVSNFEEGGYNHNDGTYSEFYISCFENRLYRKSK